MVTKVFDDEVYDESIRLLRPFMLGSEEVFLPRVVRQARYLLQTTTKSELDPLVEWIESQLSYDKEFHPVFFKTYISKVDGTGEIAGDNSDIALAYIYGKSVKVDLDKRRYLKGFEDPDVQTIKMSLNAYLKQLMRLVFVVRSEIRGFAKDGKISL